MLMLTSSVVLLLPGSIAAAQGSILIANDSFEVGTCQIPFQLVVAPDATSIPGWDVFLGDVHWTCNNDYWESFDGIRDIDLDGAPGHAGGIQQTFPTQVGATYEVTFYMAANNHAGPAVKTMQVSVASVTQDFSFDSTGIPPFGLTASDWQEHTLAFTAESTMTTVAFRSTTGSGWGPTVDKVSVEMVVVAVEEISWSTIKVLYKN